MSLAPLRAGAPLAQALVVCVFVHGRGQSPEDMLTHVISKLQTPGVGYLLPAAPGGSWYSARAIDPLSGETRAQLGQSLRSLEEALQLAAREAPGARVALAGFSQGACLCLEYILAHATKLAGVCLFTGCRVGAPRDAASAALAGLPVYASCGDADAWIPLSAFTQALEQLASSGARLRAEIFPGRAHEVSQSECAALDAMLASAAAGRAAF